MKLKNIALVLVTCFVFSTNTFCHETTENHENNSVKLEHLQEQFTILANQFDKEYQEFEKLDKNTEAAKAKYVILQDISIKLDKTETEINTYKKL